MGNQSFGYHAGIPGSTDIIESAERSVLWPIAGGGSDWRYKTINIDSTAVDGGASPTSLLRPGLVMGKLSATNQYVDYDADATDGSQHAVGILVEEVYMLDPATAAAQDRMFRLLVSGGVKASECINLDRQARTQLASQGVLFDDDVAGYSFLPGWRGIVPVAAATYTVTAAEHGFLFTTSGGSAANFTLPTIAAGLSFGFLNLENANMIVTSAEGNNIVGLNDLAASTLTFSTSNEKIGAFLRVYALYDGSTLLWAVENLSNNTVVAA